MRISEILKQNKPTLSLEVFPPKTNADYETVRNVVIKISSLLPDFISVTYGAGGGTSLYTAQLASEVQQVYQVPALAHLSCVTSTKDMVKEQIDKIENMNIENILALRGDLIDGMDTKNLDYHHASDLIFEVKKNHDFCIGGACYPEGHPEANSLEEDILNMRKKVDAGCEFLTTQMFFHNQVYYDYIEKANAAGIQVPIVAGIMPITSETQVARILALSGAYLPPSFTDLLEKYKGKKEEMRKAGIHYTIMQMEDLLSHGVKAIHIYTMNQYDVAKEIKDAFSSITA